MLKRDRTTVEANSEWLVAQVPPAPKVTAQKLKRAAQLSREIERLRQELNRILQRAGK